MRSYSVLAIVLICCLNSCQKEPDSSLLTPTSCKLDKIYYYDGNDPIDTAIYEFTGEQVSKIAYSDYTVELQYTGGRIIKRNYVVPGYGIAAYEDVIYNGDGKVSRVDLFLLEPGLPPFLLTQYEFAYTAGKLSTMEYRFDTSATGTGPVTLLRYEYVFTGNNISLVVEDDLVNNTKDSLHYTYDANANYYNKDPNRWLSDNLFSDFNGLLIPLAVSANNVTTISASGGSSAVTYEENDKDDITALRIDGELLARYLYKCL